MRRTERLLALAEHLRSRRTGVTAEALATRFGVTVRTMYRDLASLRAASLPVGAERGRGGGYALDKNYTLPSVNFTAREAAVLISVARQVTAMRLVPFTRTLDAASEKVRAALGASAQREMLQHLEALQYVGVPAPEIPESVRAAVERAWFEQRVLRFRYRSAHGERTERRVRVRGVLMDRAETRLQCDDLERSARREFVLHRIERAVVEAAAAGVSPP